jgi:hypothetical protein
MFRKIGIVLVCTGLSALAFVFPEGSKPIDSLGLYLAKNVDTWKCPKCNRINSGKPYGWGCTVCCWPYDGHR